MLRKAANFPKGPRGRLPPLRAAVGFRPVKGVQPYRRPEALGRRGRVPNSCLACGCQGLVSIASRVNNSHVHHRPRRLKGLSGPNKHAAKAWVLWPAKTCEGRSQPAVADCPPMRIVYSAMTDQLRAIVQKHWGYASFRPLQEDAMRAVLDGRDSLLVLPTGGGKSLCYQAPAVLRGGTTVVISPLIALMKDQVDGLQDRGIPAVPLNSSLSPEERFSFEQDVRDGAVRLLYASPERLMTPDFQNLCRQVGVKSFAIDEAHCISHWGHDFRPEYRMMSRIKELFPGVSVHGYTATATEQVRADICKQLALTKPLVLVGNFDRPNLTYRVLRATDPRKQVREVLDRHTGEAGIIYCLSRKDVDELNVSLQQLGYKSLPYHAGKQPEERRRVQEAFIAEECDLIIATIAFGMGIDRSNIRFVIHTSMPKSIEHYQQETGRAGRDGLEAECVLLHSGKDFLTWKFILEKSAQEKDVAPDFLPNALKHLQDIDNYARGAVCRHRALVGYFGQSYEEPSCGACDLCLGDVEVVADAAVVAQKILSCVARVKERFGHGHVISILRGEDTEKVRQYKHHGNSAPTA